MKSYALLLVLVAACSQSDPVDPPAEEPQAKLPQVHYYSLGRN